VSNQNGIERENCKVVTALGQRRIATTASDGVGPSPKGGGGGAGLAPSKSATVVCAVWQNRCWRRNKT